jgi:hypothetical protein
LSQYLNGDVFYEEMYLNALEAFAKAYQAAAPIDNGMQLIEKLNKTIGDLQGDNYEPQDVLNAVLDIIEQALISDTQAKKGEFTFTPEQIEAFREVLRISDRTHDAWDTAKAAIAAYDKAKDPT